MADQSSRAPGVNDHAGGAGSLRDDSPAAEHHRLGERGFEVISRQAAITSDGVIQGYMNSG